MSFKEVREYAPGDDVRFMDWNTSARLGHPFSKVFEEERELTVMLLIDLSASTTIGTQQRNKQELMAEMAAVLAFAAVSNSDKVGAILFTDRIEQYIPPAKGRQHVLYIVRSLLAAQPNGTGTHIAQALRFMLKTPRHSAISFLFTDFEAQDSYAQVMKAAAARHDCIAIHSFDQADIQLPAAPLLPVTDAETGVLQWMDTRQPGFAAWYQQQQTRRMEQARQQIVEAGWDYLRFATHHDYVRPLQQFFLQRIKPR